MAKAIVRQSDGKVLTLVRDDMPNEWKPEEGFVVIAESDLPTGWQRIETPVYCPDSITRYQCTTWLRGALILLPEQSVSDMILAIVPELTEQRRALDRWELGTAVLRNDAMIETLGLLLGLDASQLDAAFLAASQIE